MEQYINNFRILFSQTVLCCFTLMKLQVLFFDSALDTAMKKTNLDDTLPTQVQRQSRISSEDRNFLSAAFAKFARLHLTDTPHTPEQIRIIKTPLGFPFQ